MGAELREKFIAHLEKRPSEGRSYGANFNWEIGLERLRKLIVQGKTTGDNLVDYALMTQCSVPELLKAEDFLHQLQDKVTACVGQEIVIICDSADNIGDRTYGGNVDSYPYKIYKLAQIQEDRLVTKVINNRLLLVHLEVNTGGYVAYSTGIFDRQYKRELEFNPENLAAPRKKDLFAIGTEEVNAWREKDEGTYQELSQLLQENLAKNQAEVPLNSFLS